MRFAPLFFFFSIALLWSCAAPAYEVVTSENYEEVSQTGFERKFIYLDETLGRDSTRERIARALNKKDWDALHMEIHSFSREEQFFLLALRLFLSEQYNVALQALDQLKDYDFNCQVQLLKTDCLYHMEEEKRVDVAAYKKKYKKAYDCAHSDRIKHIIRTRYRLLRYGS